VSVLFFWVFPTLFFPLTATYCTGIQVCPRSLASSCHAFQYYYVALGHSSFFRTARHFSTFLLQSHDAPLFLPLSHSLYQQKLPRRFSRPLPPDSARAMLSPVGLAMRQRLEVFLRPFQRNSHLSYHLRAQPARVRPPASSLVPSS